MPVADYLAAPPLIFGEQMSDLIERAEHWLWKGMYSDNGVALVEDLLARIRELEAEREVRFGPHEQHYDINVLTNLVRKDMALDQQQTFNALVNENTGLKARVKELLGAERRVGDTLDRVIFAQANSIAELLKRAEKAEAERDALQALNKSLLNHNGTLLRQLGDSTSAIKTATIERCAQAAIEYSRKENPGALYVCELVAAHIRALTKSTPVPSDPSASEPKTRQNHSGSK